MNNTILIKKNPLARIQFNYQIIKSYDKWRLTYKLLGNFFLKGKHYNNTIKKEL